MSVSRDDVLKPCIDLTETFDRIFAELSFVERAESATTLGVAALLVSRIRVHLHDEDDVAEDVLGAARALVDLLDAPMGLFLAAHGRAERRRRLADLREVVSHNTPPPTCLLAFAAPRGVAHDWGEWCRVAQVTVLEDLAAILDIRVADTDTAAAAEVREQERRAARFEAEMAAWTTRLDHQFADKENRFGAILEQNAQHISDLDQSVKELDKEVERIGARAEFLLESMTTRTLISQHESAEQRELQAADRWDRWTLGAFAVGVPAVVAVAIGTYVSPVPLTVLSFAAHGAIVATVVALFAGIATHCARRAHHHRSNHDRLQGERLAIWTSDSILAKFSDTAAESVRKQLIDLLIRQARDDRAATDPPTVNLAPVGQAFERVRPSSPSPETPPDRV